MEYKNNGFTIKIHPERDKLLDNYAIEILKERYFVSGELSPQECFARAATTYADDAEHAQRLYHYSSKLWFMFASPVLANAGTKRGMPISCFLSEVGDSREGLSAHYDENIWLSSNGGGIGSYWGNLRSDGTATSNGSRSTGSIPFMHVVDAQMLAFSQGISRRGAYAAYQNISHPEIEEFLVMRKPSGGDANRKNLNLHHGVNITDAFMQKLTQKDDSWQLIDPKSKEVTKTVSARTLWEAILETRLMTGEPYLHFIDTTNRLRPSVHKEIGLEVKTSNLCSEIVLPTTDSRTAVCCLSSVNLEYYDEWCNTNMVSDLVRMLDNVLQIFIDTAPATMSRAIFSASQERSIGLGAMGFHAYLQKNRIPFESHGASEINARMFSDIWHGALKESIKLGKERGLPGDYKYVVNDPNAKRNVHLIAVAPNASTSIICGNTSPSVEPFAANAYRQDTHNGSNIAKNKYLDEVIYQRLNDKFGEEPDQKEVNAVWKKITDNQGSIQTIKLFTDEDKAVFKTANEIDQNWVIEHASRRQKFIDQAQSINVFFSVDADLSYIHKVHYDAWKKGLKTLYYCRSYVKNRAENINTKFDRAEIKAVKKTSTVVNGNEISCIGCEG